MKKAELERRLAAAESALKAIIEICDQADEEVLKKFNEDSMKIVGKALYDQESVYPLKAGMMKAESEWYFNYER